MNQTGIAKVFQYVANPVETCDRCSQGIKYVFVIAYRDGFTAKFGSECIHKMMDNAPDMWALFNKNAKLLTKYQDYVTILSGTIDQMPRGSEYFGSGLYFVADSKGKDISFNNSYFHPSFDSEKNALGSRYVVEDTEKKERDDMARIAKGLIGMKAEIARIELFLARILTFSQKKAVAA